MSMLAGNVDTVFTSPLIEEFTLIVASWVIGAIAHSCIMGNRGKMVGNSKICIEIQSQLILPEFIYLMLSL